MLCLRCIAVQQELHIAAQTCQAKPRVVAANDTLPSSVQLTMKQNKSCYQHCTSTAGCWCDIGLACRNPGNSCAVCTRYASAALAQVAQLKPKNGLGSYSLDPLHMHKHIRIQEGVLPQRKHPAAAFVGGTQPPGSQQLHLCIAGTAGTARYAEKLSADASR